MMRQMKASCVYSLLQVGAPLCVVQGAVDVSAAATQGVVVAL